MGPLRSRNEFEQPSRIFEPVLQFARVFTETAGGKLGGQSCFGQRAVLSHKTDFVDGNGAFVSVPQGRPQLLDKVCRLWPARRKRTDETRKIVRGDTRGELNAGKAG